MEENKEKIKPRAKCMNTGNEVGSCACLYCTEWTCVGHKIARKRKERDDAFRMMSDGEMSKEKNPKQVLIDWVKEVKKAADIASTNIDKYDYYKAHLAIFHILGQCETMMTVLNNSD